jgi:hypothetical protein
MKNINNRENNKMSQPNILFYMESCKTCKVFITTAQQYNILKHFKMICIDGQIEKFKTQGLKKVPTIIIPSMNKQYEGNDCIKWIEDMKKMNSTNNYIQQDELIIPDVSLFTSGPNSNSGKLNKPNIPNVPNVPNIPNIPNIPIMNNKNISINSQVTELSKQINQLATQINSVSKPSSKNQFEVNKNNTIKRNNLVVAEPPLTNSFKNKQGVNVNTNTHVNNSIPSVKPITQLFGYLSNEMSGFSDGYAYISVDNPLPKSFLPPDKDMEIYTAPEGEKIDKRKQDEMIKMCEMERINQKNMFAQTIKELNDKVAMGDMSVIPKWVGSNQNL